MPTLGDRYTTGKAGEKGTWIYLEKHGYMRPSKEQRNQIQESFKQQGIVVNKRGFDVVAAADLRILAQRAQIILYEVKTCGIQRGKHIPDGFKGLGFTLTNAEKENAEALGDRYKFIFVNMASERHIILSLSDFFHEHCARIYPTWSIFIKIDLVQQGGMKTNLPPSPQMQKDKLK